MPSMGHALEGFFSHSTYSWTRSSPGLRCRNCRVRVYSWSPRWPGLQLEKYDGSASDRVRVAARGSRQWPPCHRLEGVNAKSCINPARGSRQWPPCHRLGGVNAKSCINPARGTRHPPSLRSMVGVNVKSCTTSTHCLRLLLRVRAPTR